MLRRCTRESGVSRGTRISLRRSLSVTSAARSMRERLVPCEIAAIVPIEQGQTTIPSVCTDPEAGSAPRSASLKERTLVQSPPVAFFNAASSLRPHSSASSRQPCADTSSHVGTWWLTNISSSRTAYGAPDAPVIAKTIGAEGVVTARNIALIRTHGPTFPCPGPRGLRPWHHPRPNPDVIKYLQDENAYTKAVMAHTEALQDRLYEEMKGRVLQNDQSVPFREGNYFYYTRLVEGKNYPIYARKRGSLTAPEEVLIDANVLAEGKPTFLIRAWEISPGEDLLAFTVDTTGGRVGAIHFKNLRTGVMFADVIPRAIGGIAWAEDNRTLFYTKPDSVTVRPCQVYRHRLGTPASVDQLVYEDKDETYYTSVFKTKSRAYIMIQSSQTLASEYHYIRADQPDAPFRVIIPRE